MLIMFKVVVAAAGTPGPLLGDNVKTTATLLYPTTLKDTDSLGAKTNVINQTARVDYTVSRLLVFALAGNTDNAFIGARGSTSADMAALAPAAGLPALGSGLEQNINLGDFDIDVTTSGNGFIVIAEMR